MFRFQIAVVQWLASLTFSHEVPGLNPGLGKNFGNFQTPPPADFTRHKNKLLLYPFHVKSGMGCVVISGIRYIGFAFNWVWAKKI